VVGTKPTLSPVTKRTLLVVIAVVIAVVVPANLAARVRQPKASLLRLNRLIAAVPQVLLHRVTKTVT
jgi:branched-subunit amino acid transport protein